MNAHSASARGPSGPLALLSRQILMILGLAILDAFGILLVYAFLQSGDATAIPFALVIAIITIGINVIVFVPGLYPLRWMSPGLVLMTAMVLYPLIFTVYTAFTNYSDGHLYTKEQAIALHAQRTFIPEDAPKYAWTAFVSQEDPNQFALWLTRGTGDTLEVLFARPGQPFEVVETDAPTPPETYQGYRQMERRELVQNLATLQSLEFGAEPDVVVVSSARDAARAMQRYVFDPEQNAIVDRQTDTVYYVNEETGSFVSRSGAELTPGFWVPVGFKNFLRFLESPALRGPLVTVFTWTVAFAALSVLSTFTLGLFMALVLNSPNVRGRKLVRSLLIIPYAIPGVISILVWRGIMNPNLGVLSTTFGINVPWFSDPFWAKFGVLLVNLWLGYPYMMLITSGALQAIPTDIYEAAAVDGASGFQRFWQITLPLLLVAVGPLLIASFTFNFNNFVIIEAFNEGGPPIPGTLTPAGYTDILISYTFRLAFGTGRGADYGLASAITVIIFLIVASITLLQFRFTGQWEEVSENV